MTELADIERARAIRQALLDFAALLAEAAITLDTLVVALVGEDDGGLDPDLRGLHPDAEP